MSDKARTHFAAILLLIPIMAVNGSGTPFRETLKRDRSKISPVLLEEIAFLRSNPVYDYEIPVIIRLEETAFRRAEARRVPDHLTSALPLVNGYGTRLRASSVYDLLANSEVEYVSLDALIRPSSTELAAMGADKIHSPQYIQLALNQFAMVPGLQGQGIGIAVIDSGVRHNHPDLGDRVVKRVDFTSGRLKIGASAIDDNHGHGTHVAGVIASSHSVYRGAAPAANLISVKVVDQTGSGLTSNLIQGIQWVIDNRNSYNIRVANLSVGHPPLNSYKQDPLCLAVEGMVAAGIVTVVSAGNTGKTPSMPKVWGAINSPANDPAVIAVGAVNTQGTATHLDDVATSYSSRGPSFQDGFFKPELSAPGNMIASAAASGTTLYSSHPNQLVDPNHMRLSGSSMAAGYVSGIAALMLQANPSLTPRMVKVLLLATAAKLRTPQALEQGNGLVNAFAAVKAAAAVNVANKTVSGEVPAKFAIGNEEVSAGGAYAHGRRIVYTSLAANSTGLWGNNTTWQTQSNVGSSWLEQLFGAQGQVWSGSLSSDVQYWETDPTVSGNSVFWTEAVFWVDGVFWTSAFFWTDGYFWADSLSKPALGD